MAHNYQSVSVDRTLVARFRELRPDLNLAGWIKLMLKREIEKAEHELAKEAA